MIEDKEYIVNQEKRVHLIGIGGISMSAIAQVLKKDGWEVTGSDMNSSTQTEILKSKGIEVTIGHNIENVEKASMVIYTAAIPKTDPEYVRALELGKDLYERAAFLGILVTQFEESIGISGTHGKTTTTSMISNIFLEAKKDPSIQVGAYLNTINSNYHIGRDNNYFIFEACEYKDSFLYFHPSTVVITNIDEDHLDYFKTMDGILESFRKYATNIKKKVFINVEDNNSLKLYKYIKEELKRLEVITFGENLGKYRFKNVEYLSPETGYKLKFTPVVIEEGNERILGDIRLKVSGRYNILNALSAIAVAVEYGIDEESIIKGLEKFTGASRRFEYKGKVNGAEIYDDYAHHPTEIKALVEGIKHIKKNKSIGILEVHTYTRALNHADEFAESMQEFDKVVVIPIYAAREINTTGITGKVIADKIKELGTDAVYIEKEEEIVKYVKEIAEEGDLVVTIGAGDVTKYGNLLKD